MSVNRDIQDALTKHQIFVQRYAKGNEKQAAKFIDRLVKQVVGKLSGEDLTDFARARYEQTLVELKSIVAGMSETYDEALLAEIQKFGEYEAEFNFDVLDNNLAVDLTRPSPEMIQAAMATDIMQLEPTKGYTIREALREFSTRKANHIVQLVRDGSALGQTTQEIIANIQEYAPTMQRQASTLARTITNHISTSAREITMRENDDVIEGYKWIATLDGRTSVICMARDGQVYQDIDRNPKPPAHFSCRSSITFVIKPEYDLGAEGEYTRASMDGQVSDKTNYNDWLKRQDAEFQDHVLGKDRADIFRKGNLTLDKFVDASGQELSLDRLKELDKQYANLPKVKPIPASIEKPKPRPKKRPEPEAPAFTFENTPIYGKKTAKQWDGALIPNLTPAQLQAVSKANKPKYLSTEKSGVYYASDKTLYAKKVAKKESVVTHEYGHHIDYEMNNKANEAARDMGMFSNIKARSEIDQKFREAFEKDKANLTGMSISEWDKFVSNYRGTYFELYKKRANSRYSYLRAKSLDDFEGSLSDIIDAMTSGYGQKKYHIWGHGVNYYSRPGADMKETFANLFALANQKSEVGERARRWLPNLFARFEELLDEYNNGVIE